MSRPEGLPIEVGTSVEGVLTEVNVTTPGVLNSIVTELHFHVAGCTFISISS